MTQRLLGLSAVAVLVVASILGIASMVRATRAVIDRNELASERAESDQAESASLEDPDSTTDAESLRGRIAFAQDGRIVVAAPDGSDARFVTQGPHDFTPVWSPDGSRIAYGSTGDDGQARLFVVAADGTDAHQVADIAERDSPSSWHPDGTRLAFRAPGPPKERAGVYVAQADGSGTTQAFAGATNPPQWSPDGRSIAFTFNPKPTAGGLFVIPADSTVDADAASQVGAVVGGVFSAVAWSPDGSELAVRGVRWKGEPVAVAGRQPTEELVVYSLASQQVTELTSETSGGTWAPQWSPDGQSILYLGGEDGAQRVMVAPTTGGEPRTVFMSSALVRPVWSPDGTELAVGVAATAASPPLVNVVRADGLRSFALAPGEFPTWGRAR